MDIVIHWWFVWLIGMLAAGAYAVLNQVDRIASILAKIDLKLKDISPLFFNGRKFTWFVISVFVAFGFSCCSACRFS
jgi:hypothetical protein